MISIVIPVFDEMDSLEILHGEIDAALTSAGLDYEIIFVDDGSRDDSWKVVDSLARKHPQVQAIRFRRNFGKAAALSAGFSHAAGDVILTLDADLQDDPAEIPRFLGALNEGKDVISGWKKKRLDPWHKVWPSRVFNRMVGWMTGVHLHDHNCGMKAYRADVLKEIRLYGELHRFIPVLAAARGFTVGEIEINHRPRRYGSSKYGFRRFVKGFLDLLTVKFLTGFGQRPQHLLGSLGLISFVLGTFGMVYLAIIWAMTTFFDFEFEPLHRRPLLTYSVAAQFLGVQLMSIGFLAELTTAYLSKDEDSYSIKETILKKDRPAPTMTESPAEPENRPEVPGADQPPAP